VESAQPVFPPSASTTLAEVHAAIVGLAQPASEAEAIEQLQQYEAIKATAAAQQARATALLEQYRLNAEAEQGIPKTRWGKGLAAEIEASWVLFRCLYGAQDWSLGHMIAGFYFGRGLVIQSLV